MEAERKAPGEGSPPPVRLHPFAVTSKCCGLGDAPDCRFPGACDDDLASGNGRDLMQFLCLLG